MRGGNEVIEDFKVPLEINQKVVRFDISMSDMICMKISNSTHQISTKTMVSKVSRFKCLEIVYRNTLLAKDSSITPFVNLQKNVFVTGLKVITGPTFQDVNGSDTMDRRNEKKKLTDLNIFHHQIEKW